jgi:hypothetical protein
VVSVLGGGGLACVVPQASSMTSSLDLSDLSVRQQRIVDALRAFFGAEADALYEANGRSLQKADLLCTAVDAAEPIRTDYEQASNFIHAVAPPRLRSLGCSCSPS